MKAILSAPSAGSHILTFERLRYEIPRYRPARSPALCCFLSRGTVRASPRSHTAVSQALAGDRHYTEIRPWSWPHDSGHMWEAVSPHLSCLERSLVLGSSQALACLTFSLPYSSSLRFHLPAPYQ